MPEDDAASPEHEEFVTALQKWRAVRAPGPRHELLADLAGEWSVLVRFHGGDEPYESEATATRTLAHGGRFLVEELTGEIQAPDEAGAMRPEPYSATRILGYDRFKNAWVGVFLENQNTSLLSFVGPDGGLPPGHEPTMFGLCDEPMLDLHDGTMKYVLRIDGPDRHVWEVFAMAAGGRKVFDFVYER